MIVNLIILLGIMSYLGATMTLPGIAGFILTIGIGVDSNVLIFERIREELAAGKSVKNAVAAGFDRVFLTILDTHIASLISAAPERLSAPRMSLSERVAVAAPLAVVSSSGKKARTGASCRAASRSSAAAASTEGTSALVAPKSSESG